MVGSMNMDNINNFGSGSGLGSYEAGVLGSDLIGTLGSLGVGIFNSVQNSNQAAFEREMANKNFESQRANYADSWDWNHNKMLYSKADYLRAGFNPVLAAGAQQSLLTPNTPLFDTSGIRDLRSQSSSSLKNIQDILLRNRILQDMAEIRKTEADISRSDSEALLNAVKMRHTSAGARYYDALADKSIHDTEIYKLRGTPTNEPMTPEFRTFEKFLDEYGLLGGALQLLGIGGLGASAGKLATSLLKPGNVSKLGNWLKRQGSKGRKASDMLYQSLKRGYYKYKWW